MASTFFLKGVEQAFLGQIDFDTDTIKAIPMQTGYTPNAGTDQFLSDISSSQATGTTAQTLANAVVRIDTGNSRVELDADNISESSVTTTTNKVVIYKDTGAAATSPLIVSLDISEGTLSPVAGTLTITFNAEGLFAIPAA